MFKPIMLGAFLTGFTLISASFVMADSANYLKAANIWTTPPLTQNASLAVYLTLENTGDKEMTILGVSTPAAEHAMIHQTTEHHGTSHMDHLAELDVPGKKTLEFKPGGLHVMLMGLKKPLKAGDTFPLTLEVEKADPLQLSVEVRSIDAKATH